MYPEILLLLVKRWNMDDLNIDPLRSRVRIVYRSTSSHPGESILYVMSRDMRVHDNHALLCAQKHALRAGVPLAVVFVLKKVLSSRSKEHYHWMIEHLKTLESELQELGIAFMLLIGNPEERLRGCVSHLKPEALYFDFSPLKGPQKLLRQVGEIAGPSIYEVDTHNVVPVWLASNKQEVGARTLRPKIHKLLGRFLQEPDRIVKHPCPWPGKVQSIDELRAKIDEVLSELAESGQADLVGRYPVGEKAAMEHLRYFISGKFQSYAEDRNNPSLEGLSGLSPYLHFGALSSLRVAIEIGKALSQNSSLQSSYDTLIEEMIVRKELSDNYCYFAPDYLSLEGAPEWARTTLQKHAPDPREFLYSREEFEKAKTHDTAWNASQLELVKTGKMHGYMRMYWAKKVLEWSTSPEEAIQILIYLNDFYSIDGGDPNGYTGIMWSVAGVHDRPWGERPIYGTVRSMVYNGLKRKFDIRAYEQRWA